MLLNYECSGSGAALIVLHGLFGSLDNWQGIREKLSAAFRVCAVDQRNHGKSPHSDGMNYRLMAEDLAEVLDAENIRTAHLLGHSMGGKTAMQFALIHPDRVASLIVADIAPKAYRHSHLQILAGLQLLDLAGIRSRSDAEQALAPFVSDLEVRRFLLKNLRRRDDGSFRWQINVSGISKNYTTLTENIEEGAAFAGPTLFIRGELSTYVTDSDLPHIRDLFPNARVETIPGAGHWLHAENPGAFAALVTEFLNHAR